MLEFVLMMLAVLAFAGYGLVRRRRRVFHEDDHQAELICIVSFYDRAQTLPLIEAFFEREYITVRDLKREMKREDGKDLFTNTYRLGMPRRVDQGALVGYLSAIRTVRSVSLRPK